MDMLAQNGCYVKGSQCHLIHSQNEPMRLIIADLFALWINLILYEYLFI